MKITEQFLVDTIALCRMFYCDSTANDIYGEELQDEMVDKYPELWMRVLFTEMRGWFGEYPFS